MMKKLLVLLCLSLGIFSHAQTNFYSEFTFSDSAILNHPLTLTVSGYWDSIATSNSGPYTQIINTSTQNPGLSVDSVSVPANVLDVRVRYNYSNCIGNNVSTGFSTIITNTTSLVSSSGAYCGSINCTYSTAVFPDSSNLTGRALFGYVYGPNHSNVTYSWNMGDGNTVNGRNINYAYAANGNYTITTTITVRDVNNNIVCLDTNVNQVSIPFNSGGGCNANFNVQQNGNSVTVRGLYSGAGSWSFLVDNTPYSTRIFSHTFSGPGAYPIRAIHSVSNSTGSCTDTVLDTINIVPPGPSTFYFSGSITNLTGGTNDTAEVMLIKSSIDSATGGTRVDLVQKTTVLDTGMFWFTGIVAGTYYIKVALTPSSPSYSSKLPTYYGDELLWSNATPIPAGPSNWGINISMLQGVNPGGPGFISGLVQQGAGKVMNGGPWDVFLTTDQDVPVAYQKTDASNNFNFTNLAYGTYKVFVEVPGSAITPKLVTLKGSNQGATGVNFGADSVATGPLSLKTESVFALSVYPNPAKHQVSIKLNTASKEEATVTLFTLSGLELVSKPIATDGQDKETTLNLNNLISGLYILRVKQGEEVHFSKIQKF